MSGFFLALGLGVTAAFVAVALLPLWLAILLMFPAAVIIDWITT